MHAMLVISLRPRYLLETLKATPIYLLVLRAQEVGNEPFWNKKKLKNGTFFIYFIFFRVCRLGLVAICFYQPILN